MQSALSKTYNRVRRVRRLHFTALILSAFSLYIPFLIIPWLIYLLSTGNLNRFWSTVVQPIFEQSGHFGLISNIITPAIAATYLLFLSHGLEKNSHCSFVFTILTSVLTTVMAFATFYEFVPNPFHILQEVDNGQISLSSYAAVVGLISLSIIGAIIVISFSALNASYKISYRLLEEFGETAGHLFNLQPDNAAHVTWFRSRNLIKFMANLFASAVLAIVLVYALAFLIWGLLLGYVAAIFVIYGVQLPTISEQFISISILDELYPALYDASVPIELFYPFVFMVAVVSISFPLIAIRVLRNGIVKQWFKTGLAWLNADANILVSEASEYNLIIRSFEDEDSAAKSTGFLSRLFSEERRMEEIIATNFSRIAPCITVGKPGEKVPKPGAYRGYMAQETWKDQIGAWFENAQFIIIVLGSGDGLMWNSKNLKKWMHFPSVF